MNRSIPNLLSLIRILSCSAFILVRDNNALFIILVLFIGLTDILDGYLARRFNCQSKFGAQLDSIGDLVFFVSLLIYFTIYKKTIIIQSKELLIITVVIKCIPLLISLIKHKKILFIHTVLNKISGIVLVIGLIIIIIFNTTVFIKYMLIIIMLAGIEEAIIFMISNIPDENIKSVFCITNKR